MINLIGCRFLGLDLDGVFAADIPWEQYLADMEGTLAYRDTLPVLSTLPSFDARRTAVITGRPIAEYVRTRAWLDQHGFSEVALFCRDPEIHGGTLQTMAVYKADVINRLGCSHFYESDAVQADIIATLAINTAVYQWDAETAQAKQFRVRLCTQIKQCSNAQQPHEYGMGAA